MRKTLRTLLLGACVVASPLAVAASVSAAEPSAATIILYDAAGHPVATLTPMQPTEARAVSPWDLFRQVDAPSARPEADPFAQMDAMMNAMMARMDHLAALPLQAGPGGTMNIAMPGGGAGQVFISTFSSGGHGSCSETVTYRSDGTGAQPQVVVHRVGDACGAVTNPDSRPVPAALPYEQVQPAPQANPDTRLYKIDYRHPKAASAPLHG